MDYLHEVEHAAEQLLRLERSIETVPEKLRAVIEALQSLRGIANISAVSIMAEVGELSRFESAPADGLRRRGLARTLERRADPPRVDRTGFKWHFAIPEIMYTRRYGTFYVTET